MNDLVSSGIIAVAVAVLGLFVIQRTRARWRLLAVHGGAAEHGNVVARIVGSPELRPFNSRNIPKQSLPHEDCEMATTKSAEGGFSAVVDSACTGIEYYFHSKVVTLTIASVPGLPSAVELRVGGRLQGTFISAEFAAEAVAKGQIDNKELNALAALERPRELSDWEKSRSHHFRT